MVDIDGEKLQNLMELVIKDHPVEKLKKKT